MSALKVQLEFKMGEAGWSEVFYHQGGPPVSFQSDAISLVRERLKCLVSVAQVHHVRVSVAAPGGKSTRFPILNPNGALPGAQTRDVGNVTNVTNMYSGSGTKRQLKLHGRPDSQSAYNATGNPNISLDTDIKVFMDYLISSQYQIRHIAEPVSDPLNTIITTVAVANGVVTFGGSTAGLAVGQHVKINSARGYKASQFNGTWVIGSLVTGPPTGFTAITRRLIDPQFQYVLSSARLRNAEAAGYVFENFATYDNFETFGTRKTGRPTDSPRGRVSSRR